MERRPRRGKYMPGKYMPVAVHPTKRDESDSDSDASSVEETVMVEGEVMEEEENAEEEEEEEEEEEVGRSRRQTRNQSQSQREEQMDISDNDNDDDDTDNEEDFQPPPTPNVNLEFNDSEASPLDITDSSELGKHFSELIDTCNSLETKTGHDEQFLLEMSKNIKRGHELFNVMKGSISMEQSTQDYDTNGTRKSAGPGDMYLAFLHAKVSSDLIKNRAECIGSGPSIFSVEKYLASLKIHYVDGDGDYSPQLASANIAMESSHRSLTLNPLIAAVGALDREQGSIPKVKKPRAPPRKDNVEAEADVTTGETENSSHQNQCNQPAENLAKDMNKVLKGVYRQQNQPINIYEFTMDKNSFSKTVENIFYLSFLVKDGYVSLAKDENGKYKDFSLNIKPEKPQRQENPAPVDDEDATRNQTHREKHILSFSKPQWKKFCSMSSGENTIPYFQRLERQPDLLGDLPHQSGSSHS